MPVCSDRYSPSSNDAKFPESFLLLSQKKQLLENYEEISCDLDDEMYISRGNGFCTTKWAPDVIDDKIEELKKQIAEIEGWIRESF